MTNWDERSATIYHAAGLVAHDEGLPEEFRDELSDLLTVVAILIKKSDAFVEEHREWIYENTHPLARIIRERAS